MDKSATRALPRASWKVLRRIFHVARRGQDASDLIGRFISPVGLPIIAAFFRERLPWGIGNLYTWGIVVIAIIIGLLISTFVVAVQIQKELDGGEGVEVAPFLQDGWIHLSVENRSNCRADVQARMHQIDGISQPITEYDVGWREQVDRNRPQWLQLAGKGGKGILNVAYVREHTEKVANIEFYSAGTPFSRTVPFNGAVTFDVAVLSEPRLRAVRNRYVLQMKDGLPDSFTTEQK